MCKELYFRILMTHFALHNFAIHIFSKNITNN